MKTKSISKRLILAGLTACTLILGASRGQAQTTLAVDSAKSWIGYMNVFDLPQNGGGYEFGSSWGTGALTAYFVTNAGVATLVLTPNTNNWNQTNTYWVTNNVGNKTCDASMYVQDDTLAGQELTFTGTCLTNTLVSPFTCSVFIKNFSGSYALISSAEVPVVGGQQFSISLTTGVGDHIQYGFETVGPDVNPTNVASYGQVVLAVNNADPTLSTIPGQAVVTGQTATFAVTATGTAPFTYQWVKGNANNNTPLSDPRITGVTSNVLTISNVMTTDAGEYSVLVLNADDSTAVASAILTVTPLAQVQTNMLLDSSFESGTFAPDPTTGWVQFNGTAIASTNGDYYNSTTPVSVLDGTNALQMYSNGNGSYNGVYQDRPVVAGQIYTGDVWLYSSSLDPISATSQSWVEAQYFNSNSTVVGYFKSAVFTTNTPYNTWIKFPLTNHLATDFVTPIGTAPYMVAPAGATRVRFQINYLAEGAGSVYADAADLTLKEAAPKASVSGGIIKLVFPTLYGPTYAVYYKTNLVSGTWQTLTTFMGDGTTHTVTDTVGPTPHFYKVLTQ